MTAADWILLGFAIFLLAMIPLALDADRHAEAQFQAERPFVARGLHVRD